VLEKKPARANGLLLGVVRDVRFVGKAVPGTPLLVVEPVQNRPPGRQDDLLIPLAEQICTRIDTSARVIEVNLPDGLLGLNEGA